MKKLFLLTAAILLLANTLSMGQQQMKQHITMRLDSIGNATITLSMKMNAASWQMWLQTYGNNPAALKRQMEQEMPAYFLDDFKLEKKDMDRSFVFSVKAYGVCKVDKQGNWILETDEKNVELTKLSDQKYMYVATPPEFGGQVQQTNIIEFPEEAQGIDIGTDAYGKTQFKFKMEQSSSGVDGLRWAGILMLLTGAVWSGANLYANRKQPSKKKRHGKPMHTT